MQKISASESLRLSILVLEQRKAEEAKMLGEQFETTWESFMPFNILRKLLSQGVKELDIKDHLIRTISALLSGYVSRKMMVRSSHNPIYRLAGLYVQFAVTRFINNHAQTIEKLGHYLIVKLSERFHNPKADDQEE